jgi:hypothetical protein
MTLSSVVFRNMSSEPRPQPSQPQRRRSRRAGDPGAERPVPTADPATALGAAGAAEIAGALGYDPDDPATWPGGAAEVAAGPAGAELPVRRGDADPAGTEPVGADPVGAEPVGADPAGTEPVGADPVGAEPVGAEPVGAEPVGAEPVGAEPVGAEPVGAEPVGAEPADAGLADPAAGETPADEDAVTLTDAKAMRALAHPLRMAMIELFSVRQTLTATQASDALGESPANCAFHLRTLAKYGFVREAGGGRGRERPWTLANRRMTLTTNQPDPGTALAAVELSRLWLERWIDRARRVYGGPGPLPGWDGASGWSNNCVYMTPEETASLRRDMSRLLESYEDRLADPALRPAGALPVEWTVFTAPAPQLAEPDGPDADDRH